MPEALARKYPSAGTDLEWQWLCRTKNLVRDPATGLWWRHPVAETGWQVAVEYAARRAGITKKVTPHVLRHSLATEMTRSLRPRAPPLRATLRCVHTASGLQWFCWDRARISVSKLSGNLLDQVICLRRPREARRHGKSVRIPITNSQPLP